MRLSCTFAPRGHLTDEPLHPQSSQQAVVYNLSLSPAFSVSPIEHALYGHDRAVTDVNWSPGAPEVLATCAMDGWVMAWDLSLIHI